MLKWVDRFSYAMQSDKTHSECFYRVAYKFHWSALIVTWFSNVQYRLVPSITDTHVDPRG